MRLLALALCVGLAAALPTAYDVADNVVDTTSEFHSSKTSSKTESSHVSETSYFVSNVGTEIVVAQAEEYGLECFPSTSLTESAEIIVEESIDEEETASSSAAGAEAAASSSAVEGAAASSAAGEGAAVSSAAAGGSAASSAAGEGAAASSAAGGGAAASSAAHEGAAASSAAHEGAAASSAAGGGAAASSAAHEGAAASSAAHEGAAASSAAGEGAAASSAAGGGAAASSAAHEGAAASSAAHEGAAASSAAGEGAAASSAAGGGAAASSAAHEGAAASSAAGEGAAASSAAGGGAASSAAAHEGSAASSSAGHGAAASSAAGEGAAASSAAGEGAAATSAAGEGAAASSTAGAGATSGSITHHEYEDFCKCTPYYMCKDENIHSDGAGLIDIRFGSVSESRSSSKCKHTLAVCCTHPETSPLPDIVEEILLEPYHPSCGKRKPEGFNVNIHGFKDSESQFGEFTWMAIVLEEQYQGGQVRQKYLCGGSLISPGVILTAGHCIKGKDVSRLVVRLGDWDTKSTAELLPHQEVHVKHFVVHERLNERTLANDVALLFLDHEVELQPHIDTICLPDPSQELDYDDCVATGFGRDQFEGGVYQNVMKQVNLQVVPHDICEQKLRKTRLGRWFQLHDTFTCAGGLPGVDTCRGDGGSPLACPTKALPHRYVQVGIVAWGIGCGQAGVPGVYGSVIKLLPWIHEHINDQQGHSIEELTVDHEPVQVCITKNPVHVFEPIVQAPVAVSTVTGGY